MNELYDLKYIEEISMGNPNIKKELISMFIDSSKIFIEDLKKTFTENNWEDFHKLVHSYTSEIGMIKPNENINEILSNIYNYKGEENKKEEIWFIVQELEIQLKKIIISLTPERGD